MSIIDFLIGFILLWAIYRGFSKGFILEIAKFIALIAGIWGAIHFSEYINSSLVEKLKMSSQASIIVSFILTFIFVVIIIYFLARILEKALEKLELGFINSLLGAAISVLKYSFLLSILFYILGLTHLDKIFISQDTRAKSYLFKPVVNLAPTIIPKIKQLKLDEKIDKINEKVDKLHPKKN